MSTPQSKFNNKSTFKKSASQKPASTSDVLIPKKYYAVKIGHHPGIYPCWDQGAKEQVAGFKGAVYKSFKTLEEAQVFMDRRGVTSETVKAEREWQLQENKRVRTAYTTGNITNLQPSTNSDSVDNITDIGAMETARQLISSMDLETLHPRYWTRHQGYYYIFTDGSYMPNTGHVGYGVCLSTSLGQHGQTGQYNGGSTTKSDTVVNCLYRPMPTGTTNNQCEMLAIASVLYLAWQFRDYFGKQDTLNRSASGAQRRFLKQMIIVSDSSYCINAISKWVPQWIRNNWHTADGKPVKNRELLEKINELLHQLMPYINITFQHQNSHLPAPPAHAPMIQRLLWEGNFLVDLAAKERRK